MTSLLDDIANPTMDDYSFALSVENRPTPFFEALGAHVSSAWDHMFVSEGLRALKEPGSRIESSAQYAADRAGFSQWETEQLVEQTTRFLDTMSESDWKASPFYRPGLPFQENQTPQTWSARADHYDAEQFRAWQMQNRRSAFWGEGAVMFAGEMVGGAVDPVNYIPFGGPAFRAALVARGLGRTFAHVLASGAEAAIGTAAVEPFLIQRRRIYGEDVGFAAAVTDIAMGALTGATIAAGTPLVKAIARATGKAVMRGSERIGNLMSPQPAFVERRSLMVLDKAVGDFVNNRRIDVGPEAQNAARTMRRLTRDPEAIALELRQSMRERGINVDVILPRPARPSRSADTGASGKAATVAESAPGTIAPPTPEAAGGPSTPASRAEPSPESRVEQPSPASREAFETNMKRDLERNAAETLTKAEARGESLRAQMRELSQLPEGPEKAQQVAALKEQIDSNNRTIQSARLALREGVAMPSATELDVMHAAALDKVQGNGAAKPRPVIDRMDTTVGSSTPEEKPAVGVERVEQAPSVPLEETVGVNPDTGEFDELASFKGAQRLGRVAQEDMAAFAVADKEFQNSKKYPDGYDMAATCLAE